MYTLDLTVIKIDPGKLDKRNYIGNAINIGKKYTGHNFINKVYLHPSSPKLPVDRLVKLQDQNGAKTDTTIGKANNVSSYTRTYLPTRSCVADAFNRVGGILTSGSGAPIPATYLRHPISFIMQVLHKTKRFQHAHLNPVLA
ncbi:hypothetical protein EI94DRAFT_1800646 [Lactarius quietus]|nr:hypothetical protein EI94DRAFT_1800646 [Lactarius quietus]